VRLGESLRRRVRSIDAAARFGGDEFALILSETQVVDASRVVEELQGELRGVDPGGAPAITLSVGLVEWDRSLRSVRDAVVAADAALYRAKRAGKDRLVVARPAERG
jgi:diguanylate cyclase (GGDEF)-like protein